MTASRQSVVVVSPSPRLDHNTVYPLRKSRQPLMPTAHGWIKNVQDGSSPDTPQNTRFQAMFWTDSDDSDPPVPYYFAGVIVPSVPAFKCSAATLMFDEDDKLTGTQLLDGKVGETDILFHLNNGPQISGRLDAPASSTIPVVGYGVWGVGRTA
ncbi:hypothetical protein BDW22DRAFT_1359929 [Trametopsis cervina]|nr:hypothetical protein BDW22DRAFT_1359929 [Trametopsis cervina]